uniref:Uncharacterized protein n=1 Tax=Chromera velia CCMP2878 TaxID=1169474 RepID=A0A0G4H861_9ALVE|eukprot:Cvel_25060.t1-p1 / transcript=Cvel_25060.t1 / gene=Cvel_25060 / organism=Chromera_velia_CCMP2878 / gene_product=hypothetical protein / transcript_product=hypothetical protein / location=Cvel_scaffold2788:1288-4852(-) / protein_length=708 / sequence_SO=supercontig / SO=protein_coding / is_pseudo=false
MRLLAGLPLIACIMQAKANLDTSFKLEDLADSLQPEFGLAGLETKGKGKGGFDDYLSLFLGPPSLNTSIPVYSTDLYSIEFSCLEFQDQIRAVFILEVTKSEEDSAFMLIDDLFAGEVAGIPSCPTRVLTEVDGPTGFKCVLGSDQGGGVSANFAGVEVQEASHFSIRFSDGSQALAGDQWGAVVYSGAEGNETLAKEFGIPSSCAFFGSPLAVKVPKDAGFKAPTVKKQTDEKKEGGLFGDLWPFKDGTGGKESGDFKLFPEGLKNLGLGGDYFGGLSSFAGKEEKGGFSGVRSFFLPSPSLNSTVTVLSTPTAELELACVARGERVFAAMLLTVKGGKQGISMVSEMPSPGDIPSDFPFEPCEDLPDLSVFPPDSEYTCLIETNNFDPTDGGNVQTEVDSQDYDEIHLRFSNGLQISYPDDSVATLLTSIGGNVNLTRFFDVPSSCAIFGPLSLEIPKGLSFQLNNQLPSMEKEKKNSGKDNEGPMKLGGLKDSLKFDWSLSNPIGSAISKSKGSSQLVNRPLNFFVAPASLNSTSNILSTESASVDFACVEDPGSNRVLGLYILTVKAGQKDTAFALESPSTSDNSPTDIVPFCEELQAERNALVVVPAGTELRCLLEWIGTDSLDETDVVVDAIDEVLIQFSDGFQITKGDQTSPVFLTGVNGNATLTDFFGVPSSCATAGRFNLLIPKGVKVDLLGGSGEFEV